MEIHKGIVKNSGKSTPKGWIIRICKEEDTEGFYLYLEDPYSDEGFDYWFQNMEDAFYNISAWELEVEWENPIESMLDNG